MFKNLQTDQNIENEVDSLGSSGPLNSDIYLAKINLAYTITSSGGAMGVVLHLGTETRELRQTLWVTSGDKKGNKNYYENAQGERKYLPGFNLFNSLCLLTLGKEAAEMETEEKVVNLYSAEAKKEVPTKVPVIVDLLDKPIYAAVLKQTVNKQVKGADDQYHPSEETRDENEIDKFFRERDKMTTAEIRGGAETAEFFDQWKTKWEGKTRDRTQKVESGTAGAPKNNTTNKPKSLFA